jgi:hypothetical protein
VIDAFVCAPCKEGGKDRLLPFLEIPDSSNAPSTELYNCRLGFSLRPRSKISRDLPGRGTLAKGKSLSKTPSASNLVMAEVHGRGPLAHG